MNKLKELYYVLMYSKGLEVYRSMLYIFCLVFWVVGWLIAFAITHILYLFPIALLPFIGFACFLVYLFIKSFIIDVKDAWLTRNYTIDKVKNKHKYE